MEISGARLWAVRIGVIAAIVGTIAAIEMTIAPQRGGGSSSAVSAPASSEAEPGKPRVSLKGPVAEEIRGIAGWINTEPLSLAALRGKVVLVDFWAYSCVNCIRTVPYLRDWNEKYASKGLVIVGLHAPEFDFERSEANVRAAVVKQGITWPVGLDNDFATWRAYRNRYWPHKFLIDKDGAVRYDRIGEGGYAETEQQIRKLLIENGVTVDDIAPGGVSTREGDATPITRELYAGYGWASGGYLGNAGSASFDQPANFVERGQRESGRIYLQGRWQIGNESVQHAEETSDYSAYVGIRFTAASVNAVVRPQSGSSPFAALVTIGGKPVPENLRGDDVKVDAQGRTYIDVAEPRLYNVVRAQSVVTRDLELRPNATGFVLYTFTFGS